MLSPGLWHKQVPKDLKENLQFRKYILEAARGNRAIQKGLIHVCTHDILAYTNIFVYQYNPLKKDGEVGPVITWDFQEAALLDRPETTGRKGILWCYEKDRTAVIEKSRDMGASWLFLIFQDWLNLFREHKQCLNISKSADAVDSKSRNSLFSKLRFMHEHLPDWLTGPIVEEKMYFFHKRTRSENSGEASTGRAGVGGRASSIFVDEFSEIKEAIEVRDKTASTADNRFFNGTHNGADTEFYRLTKEREIVKIVFHWTQHPKKKPGLYKFNKETQQVDVLDKGFVYGPQCPECRAMWPELTVGDDCPDCKEPTKDFKFVIDGTPTGGPYPGIRSPWYDKKVTEMASTRAAATQLDIDPQGAASQFFDALRITDIIHRFAVPPLWEGELDYDRDLGKPRGLVKQAGGRIKMWIHPDADGFPPRARYGMGGDVATGTGATPSCLSLGNADNGVKVLEYSNPFIEPKDFAVFSLALCWLFRDMNGMGALFAWEIPGPGQTLGDKVIEMGYRNIYYREIEHALNTKTTMIPGWPNNKVSCRSLLEDYKSALYRWELHNQSEDALRQCLAFEYDTQGYVEHGNIASPNDPSGARLNHGDLVIADALMYKMLQKLGLRSKDKAIDPMPEGSLLWRRHMREQRELAESSWSYEEVRR